MGDPFGKDMDNLAKHMGGGGGRRRREPDKKDAKPLFQYSQQKEVFVCVNGQPKVEGNVIRCAVHDLHTVEELRERLSYLMFDCKPIKSPIWMDDGIELNSLTILRDRDILYTALESEPFYGDTPKPVEQPKVLPPSIFTPSVEEQDAAKIKEAAMNARPRKFFRPLELESSASDPDPQEQSEEVNSGDLLQKYGGAQHFIYSDMLVQGPQEIPKCFFKSAHTEEAEAQEPEVETPADRRRKQKNSTEKALQDIRQYMSIRDPHAARPADFEDDLDSLRKAPEVGDPQSVGDVGMVQLPDAEPPVLSKKQKQQVKFLLQKRRAKRQRQKQKKRETTGGAEGDVADRVDNNGSSDDAEPEPTPKRRPQGPAAPPAARVEVATPDDAEFVGPKPPPPGAQSDSDDENECVSASAAKTASDTRASHAAPSSAPPAASATTPSAPLSDGYVGPSLPPPGHQNSSDDES
eukprot:NODE_1067_length_1727_cov_37.840286_g943_i0.p1 GENE.NODE_1067_length_1727_cov_37.840286_g943_i0~~NODE_1067_length_1727_cov_37.840286_g943_i0.p1  ORF type:complete len:464 (-),score=115.09 NODE_1067_length_1727_cov_37.840286_g943_i0:148-1539(-)